MLPGSTRRHTSTLQLQHSSSSFLVLPPNPSCTEKSARRRVTVTDIARLPQEQQKCGEEFARQHSKLCHAPTLWGRFLFVILFATLFAICQNLLSGLWACPM